MKGEKQRQFQSSGTDVGPCGEVTSAEPWTVVGAGGKVASAFLKKDRGIEKRWKWDQEWWVGEGRVEEDAS